MFGAFWRAIRQRSGAHSLETDEVDRRARLSEKRASDYALKPFATLTPCRAWGSSPFGVRLAAYDSRLLELCRSSDIHGTLEATKPRCTSAPVLILGFWDAAVWVGSGGGA